MDISTTKMGGTTVYCNNCGKKLPDGAAFCNMCGTKLQQISAEDFESLVVSRTNGKRKKSGSVLIKAVVIFLSLSLVAALGYVGLQMYKSYISHEIAEQKQEINYATETVLHALVNANSETAQPFMTANMTQTFGNQSKAFEILLGEDLRALTDLLGILIPGMDNLIDEIKSYEITINEYDLAGISETNVTLDGQMTFNLSIVNKPISLDFSARLVRENGTWLVDSWQLFKGKGQNETEPAPTDQPPTNSL
jgi:hypothetical protein